MRRTAAALALAWVMAAGCAREIRDEPAAPTVPPERSTTSARPGVADGGDGGGEMCGPIWLVDPGRGHRAQPDDCPPGTTPRPEPRLGTGDVQITLRWESTADLDLHVIEPDGTEIWYGDRGPTSTGGRLDVDSNVGCEPEASVENVFWPDGQMPAGIYTVEVVGFTVDGCGGGDYSVVARVEGRDVLDEAGAVGEGERHTYTFEV